MLTSIFSLFKIFMENVLSVGEANTGCYDKRDWTTVRKMLFPDEQTRRPTFLGLLRKEKPAPVAYFHTPAGTRFNPEPPGIGTREVFPNPVCGTQDFFTNGVVVADIGCGQGIATSEIARQYPNIKIYGIDKAFGNKIPMPPKTRNNISFYADDWERMSNTPDGITFDRVIGIESFGRWGNTPKTVEALQRVTKPGTVLRATIGRKLLGHPDFGDRLAEAGWDIYIPETRGVMVIVAIRNS